MYLTEVANVSPDKLLEFDIPTDALRKLHRAETADSFFEIVRSLDANERNSLTSHLLREASEEVQNEIRDRFDTEGVSIRGLYDEILELTPEQERIVNYDDEKPLIVQGVAGSGKTTVAVHRLREAAKSSNMLDGNYLLLTYNRTLAKTSERLLRKACVGAIPENAEVMTLHAWLRYLLKRNGVPVNFVWDETSDELVEEAVEEAIEEAPAEDDIFIEKYREESPAFWRREIELIAEDCHGDIQTYLHHDRSSRSNEWQSYAGTNFAMAVYRKYRDKLKDRGLIDFNTMSERCREVIAGDGEIPNYEEIIVDETQDFSSSAANLLTDVANASESHLTFLGDTEQSIYGREFSWDRITVFLDNYEKCLLETNHRTPELVESQARRLIENSDSEVPEVDTSDPAQGRIFLNECDGEDSIYQMLVNRVRLNDALGMERNRIGILCPRKKVARDAVETLKEADIGVDYYKTEGDNGLDFGDHSVKVCTVKSAKGLEFDEVILLRPESVYFPGRKNQADYVGQDYEHRKELHRRQLYVAMSRAKQNVVIIYNGEYLSHFFEDLDQSSVTKHVPGDYEEPLAERDLV
jgi:superfamily I DNA/RNA helicase